MTRRTLAARRIVIGLVWIAACNPCSDALPLEIVGDPLGSWRTDPSEAYARNIWDLQAWDGRLYLGYGDAVVNTGPTKVLAFDPASGDFVHERTIGEEGIFSYRVFGDRLYIPGIDPVGSPHGAVYVRDGAGWTSLFLENVVHASDVAVRPDRLCVSLQSAPNNGEVRCSSDGGVWTRLPTESWRAVSMFELGGELYVSSQVGGIRRVDTDATTPVAFSIPGITDLTNVLVSNATPCGDEVAFIARHIDYSTITVTVLGAYRASVDQVGSINVEPIDLDSVTNIFAAGGRCQAVTNRPTSCHRYEVTIHDSEDARAWSPRVTFVAPALARSAELLGDHFYIGLGCDKDKCTAAAGQIARVPAPPHPR